MVHCRGSTVFLAMCVCVWHPGHHPETALDLAYRCDFSLVLLQMHQPMKKPNQAKPEEENAWGKFGVKSKRWDDPEQSWVYNNQRKTLTKINLCRGMLGGETMEEESRLGSLVAVGWRGGDDDPGFRHPSHVPRKTAWEKPGCHVESWNILLLEQVHSVGASRRLENWIWKCGSSCQAASWVVGVFQLNYMHDFKSW